MKKFRVVIECDLTTEHCVSAAKLAKVWKEGWALYPGLDRLYHSDGATDVSYDKFTVKAQEVK